MPSPGPELQRKVATETRVLWVIIALAVAARAGSALYQGNDVRALPGVADQISYHELALRVVDGHGFTFGTGWWPATAANQPTAHWSYAYVLFLAAVYYTFGPSPLTARLIQAVLTGLLQPLLTWRIGRRLFGPRVGVLSAALCSVYAYFVFYSGSLMTESFFFIAVLWMLDIATALVDRSTQRIGWGKGAWAQLGIALGIASLLRQVMLLLTPVVIAWVIWRAYRLRVDAGGRSGPALSLILGRVSLCALLFAACVLPWTIRNYMVFGRFVPLNTNAGFAFFWGNHPIHGRSFIPILPDNGPGYGALIPGQLRGLSEADMDKALLKRGLGFVAEDPVRYVRLSASRIKEYLKFWPTPDSSRLSNYARVLSFGLCFPFILSGLVLALSSMFRGAPDGRQQNNPGVELLVLVAALYTLIHVLSWTLVRYRLPVDAITMPFAALSMLFVFDRLSRVTFSTGG